MLADSAMRAHLDGFLAARGAVGHDLLGEIAGGLGEPLLVVASGSVLQGFGNPSSDVDLYAVVDHESVTEFPMNSFVSGVHFDINYLQASWLRESLAELQRHDEPIAFLPDRAAWKAEQRRLTQLNRLALGLRLAGGPEFTAWRDTLREVFPGRAGAWWRGEALRLRTAARLLAEVNPVLAGQRLADAVLAALNGICAEAGELYLVDKWVGSKLRRLGRADLLALHTAALDVPATPVAALETAFDELTAPWRLPEPLVTLEAAQGTLVWRSTQQTMIQRNGLRGVLFDTADAPRLPWTGPAGDLTAGHHLLIRENLVWLSITGAAS